jgi:P27 family predicted phage terminase small subunit
MGGRGSGGHNRKPIEEHILYGTFRKDRHNKFLLPELPGELSAKIPECPKWFDDIARDEWNRVAPKLYQAGLLTMLDHAALECYCTAYSIFVRAAREVGQGVIYGSADVKALKLKRVKKPEVSIMNDAINQVRLFCREFGVKPNSQGHMILPNLA